jgi:tetratricopeptide (TPR) repeat protein
LKLESRTSVIHKFAVQRANIEPAQTLRWIENAEDRQRFASSWLTINRSDAKLIEAVVLSVSGDPAGRAGAIKMLEGGLWTEPLEIQWHRAYTNLLEDAGDAADAVMAQRYDEKLKEKPHDASLLYLRGRVASSVAESQAFYDRSIEADPKLAWSYFGKAFAPASVGDWEATHSYLEKVDELGLKDTSIDRLRHAVLLGLKHGEKLVPEYQQQLKGDDVVTNIATFMLLCDADANLDDFNSANNVQTQLLNKVPEPYRAQFQTAYGQPLFAIFGRWNEFPFSPNQPTYWDLHALLATSRVKEVLADARYSPLLNDELNMLSVAIALYATGDHDGAIQWRDKACAIYEKGRTEERRMAALLQGKEVPNSEAVNQVLSHPQILSVFHAALACFDPERKAEHIERARKLDVSRLPPHHLVEMITQKVAP